MLRLPAPVRRFLREEAAGGVALMVATAVALVWANSPWRDGLMTVFFLVVGLEIKRELVAGELRTWRRAALPVVAAAGGMAVPALINWRTPSTR